MDASPLLIAGGWPEHVFMPYTARWCLLLGAVLPHALMLLLFTASSASSSAWKCPGITDDVAIFLLEHPV